MPSHQREPAGSACWNCDRTVDRTVTATVRSRMGDRATFAVRRPCVGAIWADVATVAEQAGIAVSTE